MCVIDRCATQVFPKLLPGVTELQPSSFHMHLAWDLLWQRPLQTHTHIHTVVTMASLWFQCAKYQLKLMHNSVVNQAKLHCQWKTRRIKKKMGQNVKEKLVMWPAATFQRVRGGQRTCAALRSKEGCVIPFHPLPSFARRFKSLKWHVICPGQGGRALKGSSVGHKLCSN